MGKLYWVFLILPFFLLSNTGVAAPRKQGETFCSSKENSRPLFIGATAKNDGQSSNSLAHFPSETLTNNLGMVFKHIPSGTFWMGSPANEPYRHDNELRHQVTLSNGFYMQTTEVTQGQWKKVMKDNPSKFKECGDNCPVERVSWNEIQKFLQKLNQTQKSGHYRLPTEAEWEYACKAGNDQPFSSGECLGAEQANFNGQRPLPGCNQGEYRKTTVPVASFAPNPWGLYDMNGNVWEWCQDHYGQYPSKSVKDPKGPANGDDYINRGGGWSSQGSSCRCTGRYYNYSDYWDNSVGFRLVFEPSQLRGSSKIN